MSDSSPLSTLVRLSSRALVTLGEQGSDRQGVSLSSAELALASDHRIEGFLLEAADAIGLSEQTSRRLSASRAERVAQELHQWAASLRVSRTLEAAEIPHLLFKGRVLSLQLGADAEGRGGGDVDVLIDPGDVPQARQVLIGAGFIPVYAMHPRTPWGWKFITYRNREMPLSDGLIEVDLHWRIATEPQWFPPTSLIVQRGVYVGKSGQQLPSLSPTDALVATAIHFFLDRATSLRRLIDFARLSQQADAALLADFPLPARQLVADVGSLAAELFGTHTVANSVTRGANQRNVDYLRQLFWTSTAGFSPAQESAGALERFQRNFKHLGKYSSPAQLLPRLVSRGLVWFPPSRDGLRRVGIPHAFFLQLGRVMSGKFESHV